MAEIPGGADTQIAQQAGDPSYVGLSPSQADQSRSMMEASIARGPDGLRPQPAPQGEPIPTGLEEFQAQPEDFMPPFEDPAGQIASGSNTGENPLATASQELMEAIVILPDGTEAIVEVPSDYDGDDVKNFLIDKGVEGFDPDGSDMDRFFYGFRKEGNIMTNIQDWGISHYPFLAMENVWNPETKRFETIDALDRFGEDFNDLTPEQRRQRMAEVKAAELKADYPEINPNNLGKAGMAGEVAKAVVDPVGAVPVARVAQGVQKTSKLAGRLSASGAAWGGAYGASEVLAEDGAPTTLEEMKTAAPKVIGPAIAGAVATPILGVPLVRAGERLTGKHLPIKLQDTAYALKFGKRKLFPSLWEAQAAGMDSSAATRHVQKRFGLSNDDLWRVKEALLNDQYKTGWKTEFKLGKNGMKAKNPMESQKLFWGVADNAQDAMNRMGANKASGYGDPIVHGKVQQQIDDFLRPIVGVVKDISPKIGHRLLRMEGDILRRTHFYHDQFRPFFKQVRRMAKVVPPEQLRKFNMALQNNNREAARRVWMQHGFDLKSFDNTMKHLDGLSDEMEAAGVAFDRVEGYFPRLVEDHLGMRSAMGKNPRLAGLDKALSKAERKANRDLTDAEKSEITNRWLQRTWGKKTKDIKQLKKRKVRQVTDDISDFYYDPATSLEFHLREAISKMERNKFYGKGNVVMGREGLENVADSVGKMVQANGIKGAEAQRLKAVLNSRFITGEETGMSGLASLRSITGGMTLGNPISAIRQLGDIPAVMKTQGVMNTMASFIRLRHPEVNPKVAGYMLEMAQEMDTGKKLASKVRRATDFMYKAGGFRAMDNYTKGTFMRAALRNTMKSQDNPKNAMKFMQKYSDVYEADELAQLVADIKAGNLTDLVKSHVNSEIMRIQPISRSHMPKKYLDHPNGRVFYQFRTWGLNQIEMVRRDIWREITSGDATRARKGAEAAVVFLTGVGTTNAAISEAQKLFTGRNTSDEDEIPAHIVWQMLGNFGLFDRYGIEKAAAAGDPSDWLASFIPPSFTIPGSFAWQAAEMAYAGETLGEGMQDVMKETGMGRLLNYWWGGGAEEYNEKIKKRKQTETNKILGHNLSR